MRTRLSLVAHEPYSAHRPHDAAPIKRGLPHTAWKHDFISARYGDEIGHECINCGTRKHWPGASDPCQNGAKAAHDAADRTSRPAPKRPPLRRKRSAK